MTTKSKENKTNNIYKDLLNELETVDPNREQRAEDFNPLANRIYTNQHNLGSYIGLAFNDSNDRAATSIRRAIELKLPIYEGKNPSWYKLLPIDFYENLKGLELNTDENSIESEEKRNEFKLYKELTNKINEYHRLIEHDETSYTYFRFRNYLLFYIYVINYTDSEGKEVKEKKNTPQLIICHGKESLEEFRTAIETKTNKQSSTAWMDKYFNRSTEGRSGLTEVFISKSGARGAKLAPKFTEITEEMATELGLKGSKVNVDKESITYFDKPHIHNFINPNFSTEFHTKALVKIQEQIENANSEQLVIE